MGEWRVPEADDMRLLSGRLFRLHWGPWWIELGYGKNVFGYSRDQFELFVKAVRSILKRFPSEKLGNPYQLVEILHDLGMTYVIHDARVGMHLAPVDVPDTSLDAWSAIDHREYCIVRVLAHGRDQAERLVYGEIGSVLPYSSEEYVWWETNGRPMRNETVKTYGLKTPRFYENAYEALNDPAPLW